MGSHEGEGYKPCVCSVMLKMLLKSVSPAVLGEVSQQWKGSVRVYSGAGGCSSGVGCGGAVALNPRCVSAESRFSGHRLRSLPEVWE